MRIPRNHSAIDRGTTLIDFLLSMAIVVILFGGVYTVYVSIVSSVQNSGVRTAAAAILGNEIEVIRNLPYASVGTTGGIPAGVLAQSQTVRYGKFNFTLQIAVRNIDDPFDGTLGGTPNDTAPADYKLVTLQASCPACSSTFLPVAMTTTVAPKNLESNAAQGSLFIYALDADGNPVSDASVRVTNASVTPSINLTDTTNASGVLQLVGAPTSTQAYKILVTKAGYSTDQTYPPGAAGNPNPNSPNLTVVTQTVTAGTFRVDRVSEVDVAASDNQCRPVANEPFSVKGAKTIGPGILKFSTSSATGATGTATLANLEWDTYLLTLNDATRNIAGTIPLNPIAIDPNTTTTFRFVLTPIANPSLLVTAADGGTGAGVPNAVVTITKGGFTESAITDHAMFAEASWSGNAYSAQSGGIDTESIPGTLALSQNDSGTYDTGVPSWLVSNTFDLGGANAALHSLAWSPASQPPSTGATSTEFQVAANNNNATWNFIGPDGTDATYFTNSGTAMPPGIAGNRYFRYKVFLSTDDPGTSPTIHKVSIDFTGDCVPPSQVFFGGLSQGTYAIDVTAPGYGEATSSVVVGAGAATTTVAMAGD